MRERHRASVAAVFAVNGAAFASLFSRLPELQRQHGLGDGTLGIVRRRRRPHELLQRPFVSDPNIYRPEWDIELDEPPFRVRAMRLGPRTSAQQLGATLFEIDPGGAVSPYHLHHGNEELLLVLSGTPRLRMPGGVRELEPGAVVAFPAGAAGAHRVFNPGDEPARVIVVSTMRFPDVVEHLDTDTWLAVIGPREGKAFRADGEIPLMDAVLRSMRAAAEHEGG